MSCNNSFNSALLDNQIAILLNQAKRELAELKKTTEAKFLIQNGKIAELQVYLKTNLSNSIRELLDNMQFTGELNEIISTTVLTEVKYLENAVYPQGHIQNYGAQGDGETDDSIAIEKAVAAAKAFNLPLILDNRKFLITRDIDAREIKNVDIQGEIISTNGSVFEVGGKSSDGTGSNINIRKVTSLKVTGLKNSLVNVDYCEKMHLYADGDNADISSLAYVQFYGAYCKELIIEGKKGTTNLSWINENVFRIKRIESVSFLGDYPHNNNHFEHVNFEKGSLNLDCCRNNYFSARAEGGININSSAAAECNFFEKEYYYRHYFGEDVSEDINGTLSFYPVNKLQTERLLKKIDSFNKNFPIGSLLFNEDGTFNGVNYNKIYQSNLIPITNTFSLKLKSDSANFRVQLKFYDENKQPILTEVDNFFDGKMSYNADSEWKYMINANVSEDYVTFFPGYAKYVEYCVIFGTNSAEKIDYVTIKLLKYINTDINISNTLKDNIYTSVPAAGYWEQGKILFAKSPRPATNIGIVCVESGTPGTWKNFGPISE